MSAATADGRQDRHLVVVGHGRFPGSLLTVHPYSTGRKQRIEVIAVLADGGIEDGVDRCSRKDPLGHPGGIARRSEEPQSSHRSIFAGGTPAARFHSTPLPTGTVARHGTDPATQTRPERMER